MMTKLERARVTLAEFEARRKLVKLDRTPLDHHGRKLERCGACGAWAPREPYRCACMAKCQACGEWHSTAAGVELHTCGRGAA